ncbi:MAG: DUF3667 domain-containing protein [Taibaiella sp.]|nr:DUF3667 domain-containing protein [Taibaiella sp.]
MSADTSKEPVCPNCNTSGNGNYCIQCGQSRHLHNDSFINLVSHFFLHYFHFDSKFWVTVKTLITRPGKLDVAYYNKQRTRYTPPIALYIFTSVVFFIMASYTFRFRQTTKADISGGIIMTQEWTLGLHNRIHDERHDKWIVDYNCDSLRKVKEQNKETYESTKGFFSRPENKFKFSRDYFFVTFYNYFIFPYAYRHQLYDIDTPITEIYNEFFHLLPKIFFLLMPLLALLYMCSFRDKRYNFVNYAVMSLHMHVFMFISAVFLLLVVGSVTDASKPIFMKTFFIYIPLVYSLLSCREFFKKNWVYTLLMGTITWGVYLALVLLVTSTLLLVLISIN